MPRRSNWCRRVCLCVIRKKLVMWEYFAAGLERAHGEELAKESVQRRCGRSRDLRVVTPSWSTPNSILRTMENTFANTYFYFKNNRIAHFHDPIALVSIYSYGQLCGTVIKKFNSDFRIILSFSLCVSLYGPKIVVITKKRSLLDFIDLHFDGLMKFKVSWELVKVEDILNIHKKNYLFCFALKLIVFVGLHDDFMTIIFRRTKIEPNSHNLNFM